QDPDRISRLIQDFILSIVPEGVEAAFPPEGQLEGGLAVRSDSESAVVKALAQAYQEISGRPTGFELAGVSVPIVSTLKAAIEAEVVLMGWGLGTDNVHAPNECFGLDRLKKGFVSIARALEILGG
ncbi:MAG: M20 family dipeptidase, partial [Proteobacteria bacterium]|nr:M20 family dipeptidase [Pseudomonadota bacterium]